MKQTAASWTFGTALFLASALLFTAEPMVGKMVLPALGGTPGVWNTCLLFYQAVLLSGYAYAHLATTRLVLRRQYWLHFAVLVLAFLSLPLRLPTGGPVPGQDWSGSMPGLWLLRTLLVSTGLPLFALATTAPLLQRWFSQGDHPRADDPYFLYAASNAGSLLALIAYPFAIEPVMTLAEQEQEWRTWFVVLVASIAAASRLVGLRGAEDGGAEAADSGQGPDAVPPVTWGMALRWGLLAFIPSSWLLGVTAYVTTDLASIPMLWTIPLALYLLTWILAFAHTTASLPTRVARAFPPLALALALVLGAGFVHLAWLPLHWGTFFVGALLCHGRLAGLRPAPRHATTFYLMISAGGALGGLFNALIAPRVFDRTLEYPLAVILACVAPAATLGLTRSDAIIPTIVGGLTGLIVSDRFGLADSTAGVLGVMLAAGLGLYACVTASRRPVRFALSIAGFLAASSFAPDPGGIVLHRERSFFGTLRVMRDPETMSHRFFHGSTLHGQQSPDPSLRGEPSTYFTRSGPMGSLFHALGPMLDRPETRVTIVGLGIGTLGCYARPGQDWTFYEIDPAVRRVAEDTSYFTYLADARGRGVRLAFVLGDARLRLREAPDHAASLIVLDAFSSDAVPVHLLSREAIRLYRSKLAEGGLLAFNLSNRYLDLDPVMGTQASDAGLICRIAYDIDVSPEQRLAGKQGSIWAVMTARESDLAPLLSADPRWQPPQVRPGARVWTDDFSDLTSYLVLGPRSRARLHAGPPAERGTN